MRVQRVQLLSAILLAVAIIETSTTEQTNEILNDEVNGDASRGFIFDKDFDKYLQAEDGEDNGDGGDGGNNGDGGDGGNDGDGGDTEPPNSSENDNTTTTVTTIITEATDTTTTVTTIITEDTGDTTTDDTTTDDTTTDDTTTDNTTTDNTTTDNTTTDNTTTDDPTTTPATDAPTTTERPPIGSEEYPIKVSTCIFANMTITLEVTYAMKNDTTATGTLSVPSSPEVDGACNGTEAVMILMWKPTVSGRNVRDLDNVYAADPEKNKLTLHFKRSDTKFWLDKMDIDIILDEKNFPNAKNSTLSTTTDANLNLFSAPVSNSKSVCNAEISVNTKDENVKMQIKDVDLIAFNEASDITSKSESNCVKEDIVVETSDVGAIVGGIIGALAIVGIIGFIIWRRRRNSYAHSEVA